MIGLSRVRRCVNDELHLFIYATTVPYCRRATRGKREFCQAKQEFCILPKRKFGALKFSTFSSVRRWMQVIFFAHNLHDMSIAFKIIKK